MMYRWRKKNDGNKEECILEDYIWLILTVFILLVISYYKSTKQTEDAGGSEAEKELHGIGGIYDGQKITVRQEIVIGRDPHKCSIIYPEGAKGVSAVHCSVHVKDTKVELTDLSSTYGTFKGTGERLVPNRAYSLEQGDSFYVGAKENTFVVR